MAAVKQDTLLFFEKKRDLYPLYETFEKMLLERFPQTDIKVQKSQISFSNRHIYACVSFLRIKKALLQKTQLPAQQKRADTPALYFVLTLGLPYPLDSGRVAVKTEPYPGRWTTHLPIRSEADLDPELFTWIRQAYEYAQNK